METIVFFWIAFAIIVGVAANTRGRNGVGWFILAIVISPLIAGLLVLALPRLEKSIVPAWPGLLGFTPSNLKLREQAKEQERIDSEWKAGIFRPDGMVGGVPYRMLPNGRVDALIQGGRVRFESLDNLRSMINAAPASQSEQITPTSTTTYRGYTYFRRNGGVELNLKNDGAKQFTSEAEAVAYIDALIKTQNWFNKTIPLQRDGQ